MKYFINSIKNKKVMIFLLVFIFNISCSFNSPLPMPYENTNFVYLSHNKGVDILNTDTLRISYKLNEDENSGNVGIINSGKQIIINNLAKNRLDIYSISQQGYNKIGEISLTAPVIDIVYKDNEAFLISENKITFIKSVNNIAEVSGSLSFDQKRFEKAVLSKNSDELFIYDSAKQEFIVINTKQNVESGNLKVNMNISIGGLDIDKDKRLFFTDKSKSDIYVYDLTKHEVIKKIEIPVSDGVFSQPTDIKVFENKKIYVANSNKNFVSVIDYKSLEIINEIKYFIGNTKPYKLFFIKLPDGKIGLLEICSECSEGFKIIETETDKYKLLSSTGTSLPIKYEFIASSNY